MYFTDIFEALASDPRRVIIPVPVLDATEVMAFNTRAELAVIERVYRDNDSRRSRILPQPRPAFPTLKTVAQWKSAFERGQPALKRFLRQVYSQPSDLRLYESLAEGFGERFGGARKFAIIRAPGRVNLMGRHIDHQGGPTNVIATDHKVLVAAAPRDDDLVRLFNRDHSRFPARTFSIAREISRLDWADWRGLVNGPRLSALLKRTRGDWGNYVKGAVLRLQHHFVERRLRGMDLFVDGNIPAASGLSSSSALVVAAAEAFLSLNQLEMERAQFAEICAEAEWFVGTRQGATDHAAISLGRRDTVLHMGFFPLRVIKTAPLFRGHTFIICNSGQRAGKSGAAHGVYNERVTSYAIGRLMLRRLLSSRQRIGHLTEVTPETLGCSLSAIYQALAKLPDKFTTAKARAWCRTLDTDERAELEPMLDGAAGLVHHVRDICLYGVTECARAREAVRALQDHNPARFGMLMRVSHDGDRIRDAKGKPFRWSTSDAAFARLIKKPVPLWKPTGGYACSTETIDRIVDTAMKLPGVLGAQMVGAGLGGCVIILAQDGSVGKVLSTFRAEGFVTEPLVSTAGVCALVAN
jgi:N-acetylgalactosamine kinase